jgi:hypothetical protein
MLKTRSWYEKNNSNKNARDKRNEKYSGAQYLGMIARMSFKIITEHRLLVSKVLT